MALSKNEIRVGMRALEKAAPSGNIDSASIWQQVEADSGFVAADTVLLYMSIPGEVPTSDFIERWKDKKRLVLPKVCGDDLELYLFDRERLSAGYKGILEPSSNALPVSTDQIQYAVIPGVAFSPVGNKWGRLGRGKGYYDRLLPQLNCPCVGVAWSFRKLQSIPLNPWDCLLDMVYFD